MNRLNKNNGHISVKNLAEISCLSIKQFERNFMYLIGINPKQYLRIIRFQKILKNIHRKNFTNLTLLAHENGYYDQSHFLMILKCLPA